MHRWVTPVVLGLVLAPGTQVSAEQTPSRPTIRKPKQSWTLLVGLSHSATDSDHYVASGIYRRFPPFPFAPDSDHSVASGISGRFPLFALDRSSGSDRLGNIGIEIGAYPYPVI